jgi:hypothetical protein
MNSEGFEYTRAKAAPIENKLLSLSYRKEFGFGLTSDDKSLRVLPTQQSVPSTPGFVEALKSCNSSATDALNQKFLTFASSISPDAQKLRSAIATYSTPGLTEALKAWSSCMREAGYRYKNPLEMFEEFQVRPAQKDLTDTLRKERTAAVDDYKCNKSTIAVAFSAEEQKLSILLAKGVLNPPYPAR